MLSLLLIALAAPVAAPAPPPPAAAPRAPTCHLPGVTYADTGGRATQPRKLGELPPARHYLAVERHVGGCPEPAIVRSGIGTGRR
jgi:hypothetical protein